MLRVAACLIFGGLLVGCDATARTTNTPNGSKTDVRVEPAPQRPGVDVNVNPNAGQRVDVEVGRPNADKKVDVDVGRGGVQVDVNGQPLRERIEERREERRENAPPARP